MCRDNETKRYISKIKGQHIVRDEGGRFAPHAAEEFGAEFPTQMTDRYRKLHIDCHKCGTGELVEATMLMPNKRGQEYDIVYCDSCSFSIDGGLGGEHPSAFGAEEFGAESKLTKEEIIEYLSSNSADYLNDGLYYKVNEDTWTLCDLFIRQYLNNLVDGFGMVNVKEVYQYLCKHKDLLIEYNMVSKDGWNNSGLTLWENYNFDDYLERFGAEEFGAESDCECGACDKCEMLDSLIHEEMTIEIKSADRDDGINEELSFVMAYMDNYQLDEMIDELKKVIKTTVKKIDRRNPIFNADVEFGAESNFDALKTLKKRWREDFEHIGITYEEMLEGEINRLRNRMTMKGFDPNAKIGSPKYAEEFGAEGLADKKCHEYFGHRGCEGTLWETPLVEVGCDTCDLETIIYPSGYGGDGKRAETFEAYTASTDELERYASNYGMSGIYIIRSYWRGQKLEDMCNDLGLADGVVQERTIINEAINQNKYKYLGVQTDYGSVGTSKKLVKGYIQALKDVGKLGAEGSEAQRGMKS